MKTKSFILGIGLIVAFLWSETSCTKAEEVEAPGLSLDKKELQFAKDAGDMAVNITTNQSSWIAVSPHEGKWLSLEMSGDKLTVKTKANTQAEARTSHIIVSAGAATPQVIKVTQVAADINLKLLPEEVEIPREGGAFTVDVQSNDREWKVELEEEMDWIEIRPNLVANFISLVVKANESSTPRRAKLIARSSNLKKTVEVIVNQLGRKVFGEYTLPLFQKTLPPVVELIEYEEAQGNKFASLYPKGPYSGPNDLYSFYPRKHFIDRSYAVGEGGIIVNIEDVSFDDQIIKSPYVDYLIENGFEKTESNEKVWKGLNEEKSFSATITAIPQQGTVVTFERVIKQPKDFPTWDKFPEDLLFKYMETGEKIDQIRADEEAAGSTNFRTDDVTDGSHAGQKFFMGCVVAESKRPHLNNGYFFAWEDGTPENKLGTVRQKIVVYNKIDLVFWTDPETGKRFLTKEIKALLAKEGWRLQRVTISGGYYYEKGTRLILFRVTPLTDVNDGKPSLVINAFLQKKQGGTTLDLRVNNRSKYEAIIKDNILRTEDPTNCFK